MPRPARLGCVRGRFTAAIDTAKVNLMHRWRALILVLAIASSSACSSAREYELRGQVTAVAADRGEITVKHEDIRGFMPAMTMPFKVRERETVSQYRAGDIISATLVVDDEAAYLTRIARTGYEPIDEPTTARAAVDLLKPGERVPDVALLDHTGMARNFADWQGKVVAVTFTYTRCPLPDFCPLMDRHFASVQREVSADARLRDRVRLVSVSFDPEHDTPEVLAAHAQRAGSDPGIWTFVTGDRDEIDRFASRFGVSVVRSGATAADIVHNLRTAVIDSSGRLVRVFDGNGWQPAELLAALRMAS